jgi:hypothetical protein
MSTSICSSDTLLQAQTQNVTTHVDCPTEVNHIAAGVWGDTCASLHPKRIDALLLLACDPSIILKSNSEVTVIIPIS